jgi:hypothetical protein
LFGAAGKLMIIRQPGLEFEIGPPHDESQKRDGNQEANPPLIIQLLHFSIPQENKVQPQDSVVMR